jgi:hypothetical protein
MLAIFGVQVPHNSMFLPIWLAFAGACMLGRMWRLEVEQKPWFCPRFQRGHILHKGAIKVSHTHPERAGRGMFGSV